MWNLDLPIRFCDVQRGKRWFASSQTLLVYAPFAQRLNGECSSPPCIQMQSGWLVVVDGCRTVVFRRYVASRVCRSSHSLHWFKLVYHLSSTFSVVSMIVLLVLSMLSLPCGFDDLPSGLVDVVFGLSWILRGLETPFPPQMSALLVGRSAHLALSFVAQFVVIWLITYWTGVWVYS
jgi:hypothetical protein